MEIILDFFQRLYKHIWIAIVAIIFCTIPSTYFSYKVLHKTYEASSAIFVLNHINPDDPNQSIFLELLAADGLINDCKILLPDGYIIEKIKAGLQNEIPWVKNASPGAIASTIKVKNISDTHILRIVVNHSDPKVAAKIANKAADVFKSETARLLNVETISIIDYAQVPKYPTKPKPKNNVALSVLVGLLCGIGIIFIIESLEGVIKTPSSMGKGLEVRILGTVPLATDQSLNMPDEYRVIRANIQNSKESIKTILVSACNTFNKASIVSNLAVSFANSGEKVLLIDADLNTPELHTIFGIDNKQGLTNILTNNNNFLIGCTLNTSVDNLHVITSGEFPPDSAKLIDSKNIKNFIEEVKAIYSIVLINTTSTNTSIDAGVLSAYADGVILLAALDKTKMTQIQSAQQLFKKMNANMIGIIFGKYEKTSSGFISTLIKKVVKMKIK